MVRTSLKGLTTFNNKPETVSNLLLFFFRNNGYQLKCALHISFVERNILSGYSEAVVLMRYFAKQLDSDHTGLHLIRLRVMCLCLKQSAASQSKTVKDGDRQMVHLFACQVLLESACPFPNSFQGRLKR